MIKLKTSIIGPLALSIIAEALIFWIVFVHKGSPEYVNSFTEIQPFIGVAFNAISALFLILAVGQARKKNIEAHNKLIAIAIFSSGLFLINYLYYHGVVGDSPFMGAVEFKKVYYTLLTLHVFTSTISLPMIFITVFLGITKQYKRHRVYALATFPIWLLGSISGVIVVLINNFL